MRTPDCEKCGLGRNSPECRKVRTNHCGLPEPTVAQVEARIAFAQAAQSVYGKTGKDIVRNAVKEAMRGKTFT